MGLKVEHYGMLPGVGQCGQEWMSHKLQINVLSHSGPSGSGKKDLEKEKYDYWLSSVLEIKCYLTAANKFSVGRDGRAKWMNAMYFEHHYRKSTIINEIETIHDSAMENYRTFENWYHFILPVTKCFYYGDPRYPKNYFALQMTDAMINNIYKKMFCVQNDLWVDVVNWELSEMDTEEDKTNGNESNYEIGETIDPANGLPSSVWQS